MIRKGMMNAEETLSIWQDKIMKDLKLDFTFLILMSYGKMTKIRLKERKQVLRKIKLKSNSQRCH